MMMTHYHVALLGIFGNKRVAENVLGLKPRRSGSPFQLYDEIRSLLGSAEPVTRGDTDVPAPVSARAAAAVLSPEYGS